MRGGSGRSTPGGAFTLTRDRVRAVSLVLLVLGLAGVVGTSLVLATMKGGAASVLPDYLAHWTGGRLVLEGRTGQLYDPVTQHELQAELGAPSTTLSWFVSPPHAAFLYAPLAALPYLASCLAWTVLSVAALAWSFGRLGRFGPALWARDRSTVLLAAAASYPVLELVGGGQDSALTLAVWVAGTGLALAGRPFQAGLVLALALGKPQVVVLVPLGFLALRQWRGLGGFALGGAATALATWALVGVDGIRAWVTALGSPLYDAQVTSGQAWKMVGLPSLVTALADPLGSATAQALGWVAAAALVVVLAVLLWRQRTDPLRVWVLVLAATVVASPHLGVYDALLAVPVAVHALDRLPARSRAPVAWAFVLALAMAPLHLLAEGLGGPGSALDAPWVALPLALLALRLGRAAAPGAGVTDTVVPQASSRP